MVIATLLSFSCVLWFYAHAGSDKTRTFQDTMGLRSFVAGGKLLQVYLSDSMARPDHALLDSTHPKAAWLHLTRPVQWEAWAKIFACCAYWSDNSDPEPGNTKGPARPEQIHRVGLYQNFQPVAGPGSDWQENVGVLLARPKPDPAHLRSGLSLSMTWLAG